ncbi:MAG: tetratricopeptide repeat protein [Candidatus Eremiobacteraeota bacterium]|nr:tetratricopeptide repeat protein [Candidatus Eremiobacteraeota bacterium]
MGRQEKRKCSDSRQGGRQALLVFLLVAVTFTAFFPSLQNGFTNWDDDEYILNNPLVFELSWENLKGIFNFSDPSLYRSNILVKSLYVPLTTLSFAVEYHFSGPSPFTFHLTNLVLHCLNTTLVFWLFLLLARNEWAAFIVALLFGIHPLHVESVAWITERKDVLYAFFYLLSMIAYLHWRTHRKPLFYGLTLAFFVLSLLAKPMAITLPAVLLLLDWYEERALKADFLVNKLPFILLCIGELLILRTIGEIGKAVETDLGPAPTLGYNLIVAGYGFYFYFSKMLLPVNLSAVYRHPVEAKTAGSLPWEFTATGVIAPLVFALALYFARRSREVLFGLLFYLITILPVSQILPIPPGIAADRYFYVPSLGYFFIIALGVLWIHQGLSREHSPAARGILALGAAMVITLSILTWERCGVWKDSITLWNDTSMKDSRNLNAYYGRCLAYIEQKDFDAALAECTTVLSVNPYDASAHNNCGVIFFMTGKTDEAIAYYDKAIAYSPRFSEAHGNRGAARQKKGDLESALVDCDRAVEYNPYNADAFTTRGLVHQHKGEFREALRDYDRALFLDPMHKDALNNRGSLHAAMKEYDRAVADLTEALRLSPGHAGILSNRGTVFFLKKDYDKALDDLREALRLDPSHLRARVTLAHTLHRMGNDPKALAELAKVLERDPSFLDAYRVRMEIHRDRNEPEAVRLDALELEKRGGAARE